MHVSSQTIGLMLSLAVLAGLSLYAWNRWGDTTWIDRQKLRLGLDVLPAALFVALAAIWTVLFVMLLFGLFYVPAFLAWQDFAESPEPASDLRWTLLALAAVTAALSAVVALPFTLLRTKFNREQTEHSKGRTRTEEEGLLTDRINKAVEGLGAQKEVNRLGRNIHSTQDERHQSAFQWQGDPDPVPEGASDPEFRDWANVALTKPNLEVRIGAIYALERIARQSVEQGKPDVHVQIMEILCAYIRENAPADNTDDGPEDWLKKSEHDGPLEDDWEERRQRYETELRRWLEGVAPRTDIQVALKVIGRRTKEQREAEARHGDRWMEGFVFDHPPESTEAKQQPDGDAKDMHAAIEEWNIHSYSGYRLDLRRVDFRGADLRDGNFSGALIDGARLQGALLARAQLRGASLRDAKLKGAIGTRAHFQKADLDSAQLYVADFSSARFQGASLKKARLYGSNFKAAWLQGAHLEQAWLQGAHLDGAGLQYSELWAARLQRATLSGSKLHFAYIEQACLQGAVFQAAVLIGTDLRQASINGSQFNRAELRSTLLLRTDLRDACSDRSSLRSIDFTSCKFMEEFLSDAFGDASNTLPEPFTPGEPPLEHWSSKRLEDDAFTVAWRAFQKRDSR